MSQLENFDQALAQWFESEATAPAAPGVLASILDLTRSRQPRPGLAARWGSRWVDGTLGEWTRSIEGVAIWKAMSAAALVLAVLAIYLNFGRPNNVIGPPGQTHTPSPSATASPRSTETAAPTTAPTVIAPPVATPTMQVFSPPLGGGQSIPIVGGRRYWLKGPSLGNYSTGWPTRVTLVIPEGWMQRPGSRGGGIHTHDYVQHFAFGPEGAALSGWSVENVYAGADPCVPTLADPLIGPTVDDFVTGLASIPSVELTAPIDVTLDGFSGKVVEMTTLANCESPGGERAGDHYLWRGTRDEQYRESFDVYSYEGWLHQVWVLDLDGLRFVIDAAHAPDAPARLVTELQQMVESIDIQP